jgi:hypothetical protein
VALTPIDFALFTRAMPAAGSGASSPLSVAATAGVRMADRIGDETLWQSGWPAWSRDGESLFYRTNGDDASWWRVRIGDRKTACRGSGLSEASRPSESHPHERIVAIPVKCRSPTFLDHGAPPGNWTPELRSQPDGLAGR